ncbi:uncharacterized protein LOC110447531 isoform X1 [Mizuhopecten yessoensis]|uniref:Uncharacterized protein n=1 Tax=Mizuhopecten yessoensis TaxID=6573 RepID=A0A210QV50_MIZYE|nr:uncharacterized protein LOC110447531 isoform X1 [Mizuhopecten yessoensis]OWF52605.1 hypothetical protein KP79_PYT04070 [Mizuhopecten yessoensis]
MALQNGCMFAFSILSISLPLVTGNGHHMSSTGVEPVDRVEQIRQLLEKLGYTDDDTNTWHTSRDGHHVVEVKPSDPDSAWSVNSQDSVDISYNRNADDDSKKTNKASTTQNKLHVVRNTTITHARVLQEKPLIDIQDSTLWLGAGLGAIASLSVLLLSLVVWKLARRYYRRKRCIDLTELSFCSLKGKRCAAPVYVRLSQLHNPRKLRNGSRYVVSVLDESNNFSIDSGSESSSSEEELFNASGYKSSDNSFTQHYSGARVNLTSTPLRGSPSGFVREQPVTPPKPRPKCQRPLPISPLAQSMPYSTPHST